MQKYHKIIKVIHFVFSLAPFLLLCSCMVNGQVVLRPEDIIAKASGRTEDQVIKALETNFTAYKSAASGSDYAAIVAAAKKAHSSFEDAFYLLGDKDGSWRSAVYVKKEGSQTPVVSDKTKSTLGRGYISILHNLARMSLVVNDRSGYYSYINRATSPDPKLFNYNLMDTALEAPQQLEVTLLFSLRSSYRYFMEGHIDEAVEIAEILKLTMDKVTRECSVSKKLDKFEPAERIPYTAQEIGAIEALMKGKGYKAQTLLGANLAKEKIIAGLASKPRILHFATHGVMSNEIPYILNPTLILSITERPIDTFLQSSEIEKLDLSGVELVVLSACKTGIDVSSESEGISGIAKSFLIAGAKNVLLTYWSINDMATSAFMEHLYGEIGNGVPVAQALSKTRKQFVSGAITSKPLTSEPSSRGLSVRQKQIASGTDYTLPFYWGAFALFGKDRVRAR
jgi:hypothetical protein